MEETWELTAVSEYKDRHEDDWSGRHVRIRFEMVLSALAFFLFARYGVSEIRLPVIGTKSDVTDEFLLWAFLVFAVFSLASLITRSYYEKMRWPKEELSNWKEITRFWNDYKEIQNAASQLDFLSSDDEEVTIKKFNSHHDLITSLNNKADVFSRFLSDLHAENGVASPAHPKFWSKTIPMMANVNIASNALISLSKSVQAAKSSQSVIRYVTQTISIDASMQSIRLKEAVAALAVDIDDRKKSLYWLGFAKFLQREVLSSLLPILTSLFLVVFGLYSKFCGCSA